MAKSDFCFTYYDGDAARDMAHMNRLERGGYSDIIISQRKFGHMTIERIKRILGGDFDQIWESIEVVMTKDDEGLYFIEWLENSVDKMKRESRLQSENGKKGGRPVKNEQEEKPNKSEVKANQKPKQSELKPLEDGNGYGDVIVIKDEKENGGGNEVWPEKIKKPPTLFTLLKESFLQKVQDNGSVYSFGPKDGVNLSQIQKKINDLYLARGKGLDSDEDKAAGFKWILEHITDKWILDNFSIPIINSKWNEIINQVSRKNGNSNDKGKNNVSDHNADQRNRVMAGLL